MTKGRAADTVHNAGMTAYDVAHSIYLATVEGVSGANQNDGYGFALSAIAELWNIRGTIGNPSSRTKITGRYRGIGSQVGGSYTDADGEDPMVNLSMVMMGVAFVILKFFLRWGWIASFIGAVVAGTIILSALRKR